MLSNYFKIAVRNLLRQRAHSIINIAGLAIGLTCTMLIFLWVQDELSYDRFNEKVDDIYRIVETQHYTGQQDFLVAVTPSALAKALKEETPEVERSTRFAFNSLTVKYEDKVFTEGVGAADPDFLEMFTVPFLEGNPQTALLKPHSLVLTEETAKKYFGNVDALGKTVVVENKYDFVVTGVIGNIPHNSHLQFDMLAPFLFLKELGSTMEDWNTNWCYSYVLLQKSARADAVEKKVNDVLHRHTDSTTDLHLQPVSKIHLYSAGRYVADIRGQGDIEYVQIFSGIALFVLLIACVNFMNLATARSERRAREVGLRKVVGANRRQLIGQFLGEAMLMTLVAFCLGLLMTGLLLPAFNELSGKTLALGQLNLTTILGFLGIALGAGLIAGSYPAFVLSSYKPVETIKRGSSSSQGGRFRKILVVLQFSLSVIMIVGALVISGQIDYIRSRNLGLNKENLGYLWMSGNFRSQYEAAKQELLRVSGISDITVTSQLPVNVVSSTSGWDWDGKPADADVLMSFVYVDEDYVRTFGMKMAEGRFFSSEFGSDTLSAVVNETAVKAMGMKSPVGKRLSGRNRNMTIIGVVKDFNFKPIRTKIEPLVLLENPARYYVMVLRTKSADISGTVAKIGEIYKKFSPDRPFHFNFLDQDYDHLYRAEERIGTLSRYFAILAIFIAALGLYGLASYTAERRTKEIGIRKVLGASVPGLFILLSKEFLLMAGIANLIAWPVAYGVMKEWLQNYAYHTPLTIGAFLIAAVLAVAVIVVTTSYQAVRASRTNPVEALRYE